MKPRLLDLFCGAGLAADGYAAAGWEVTGIDINAQPHYPFKVWMADAIGYMKYEYMIGEADAIHASPPCQFLTRAKHLRKAQGGESKYPDLLTPTLELLRTLEISIPWVVENVEGARALMQPQKGEHLVRVCGSSFGLAVQRHRLFLSNVPLVGTACDHSVFPPDPITGKPRPWGVYHVPGDSIPKGGRTARDATHARALFQLTRDLPWDSIKEGFPPVYTHWIGRQLRGAAVRPCCRHESDALAPHCWACNPHGPSHLRDAA